jgi:hypothetical protein
MTTESAENPAKAAAEEPGRGRSTIEFPYLDLNNSIEIADNVRHVGGTSCDWKQLAVKMNQAADGGGFRMRVMTAKVYGILIYDRGSIELTDLGIQIIDTQYERRARVDAFMKVPLYKQLFDKLNGVTLPPPAAVERMIEQLGVAPKQKDKARQVFMRSAKQAGLFELSGDRLSLPPGINGFQKENPQGQDGGGTPKGSGGTGSGGPGGSGAVFDLDPLLIALLQKIPPRGELWPQDKRLRWFKTFAMNVSQVYDEDDNPVELTITGSNSTA